MYDDWRYWLTDWPMVGLGEGQAEGKDEGTTEGQADIHTQITVETISPS